MKCHVHVHVVSLFSSQEKYNMPKNFTPTMNLLSKLCLSIGNYENLVWISKFCLVLFAIPCNAKGYAISFLVFFLSSSRCFRSKLAKVFLAMFYDWLHRRCVSRIRLISLDNWQMFYHCSVNCKISFMWA